MSSALDLQGPEERKVSNLALFKRCLGYFKPYMSRIILATGAMLIVAACQAAAAYLVQPAMDDIFLNKDKEALLYIPLLFLLITFAKVGFRVVQNFTMQYCGLKVLEKLRDELYRKIIYLPMKFYEDTQVGMLMSRIINDVVVIRSSMPALVMLIRQILTMVSLIVVVFYRDVELAFFAVIVLPAAFYPFIYFGRRMRKLGRKGQEKLADISVLLQEIFSGIRVVKAFATEDEEGERFDKENKRLLKLSLKQTMASELSSSVMEFVGGLGIALVLWYGGLQVIEGSSTPGTFFSFVAALVMMYDPIKKLSAANNDIQKALAGAERVFGIIDSPLIQVEQDGHYPLEEPFRELDFQNVSFAYNTEDLPALDRISLRVKAGEKIALVGPSGAGKTTFVNLIPRFYDPQHGAILLNGRPLNEYVLATLRRSISIVSQDNFLFNVSIRDNITYGHNNLSEEDVIRAAKAAYAHDFIMSLPEGYDTVIGERGVKLSGGQKQRLTIARALVKNSSLLILDEATSALDSEAERIVQKALENLMENRTSIVIAHRLSTILRSDRILVMERGRIVAQGKHQELLSSCPLYAKLYTMQFRAPGDGLTDTDDDAESVVCGNGPFGSDREGAAAYCSDGAAVMEETR